MSKSKNGIRKYIIAVTLLITYLIVGQLVYFVRLNVQIREIAVRDINTFLLSQKENIEQVMELQFANLEAGAELLAKSDTLLSEANLSIRDIYVKNPLFNSIMIVDENGNGLKSDGLEANIYDRDYFKRILNGENIITPPLDSRVDDGYRIIAAVPIEKDGKVIGMFGGDFNLAKLNNMIFSNDVYEKKGHIVILDSNCNVIVSDKSLYSANRAVDLLDIFPIAKSNNKHLIEETKTKFAGMPSDTYICELNEKEYYFSFYKLRYNDWNLSYIISKDYITSQYRFVSMNSYKLFSVSLFGIFILFIFISYNYYLNRKHLKRKSEIDFLTGLFNRNTTELRINKYIEKEKDMALFCLLDLDNFKSVNDNYGHHSGDVVLKAVGEVLGKTFRNHDTVGRIGGDEFVIFLANVQSKNQVEKKIQSLNEKIDKILIDGQKVESFGCSCGIAYYPEHGKTFEQLYKNADIAMYKAKHNGNNECVIFGK